MSTPPGIRAARRRPPRPSRIPQGPPRSIGSWKVLTRVPRAAREDGAERALQRPGRHQHLERGSGVPAEATANPARPCEDQLRLYMSPSRPPTSSRLPRPGVARHHPLPVAVREPSDAAPTAAQCSRSWRPGPPSAGRRPPQLGPASAGRRGLPVGPGWQMTWDLCPFAWSALHGSLPGPEQRLPGDAAVDRGPMPLSQATIGIAETPCPSSPGPRRANRIRGNSKAQPRGAPMSGGRG